MKKKLKIKPFLTSLFLWVVRIGIVGTLIAASFSYYNEKSLAQFLAFHTFFLGLLLEDLRIGGSWKTSWQSACIAFFGAPLFFLEQVFETGNFRLSAFLLPFAILYLLFSVMMNEKRVTTQLTEGITLLQTLSFLYLFGAFFTTLVTSTGGILFLGLLLVFPAISLYHAFSPKELTKKSRLLLSLWSSAVLLVLAGFQVYTVLTQGYSSYLVIFFNYFFLGICSMYIAQNFFMLIWYIPGKHDRFLGAEHKHQIRELNKDHVERYKNIQLSPEEAWVAVALTATIYLLNGSQNWIPPLTCIWLVLWGVPLFFRFIGREK